MGVPTGTFSDFAPTFVLSILVSWVVFFLTFGGTLTAGLLKLRFLWCEIFFEVINFETIEHVSNFTDSDPFFFHNFDESFPAAVCKLHSKCPQDHLEGFCFSENTRNVLSIPNFW